MIQTHKLITKKSIIEAVGGCYNNQCFYQYCLILHTMSLIPSEIKQLLLNIKCSEYLIIYKIKIQLKRFEFCCFQTINLLMFSFSFFFLFLLEFSIPDIMFYLSFLYSAQNQVQMYDHHHRLADIQLNAVNYSFLCCNETLLTLVYPSYQWLQWVNIRIYFWQRTTLIYIQK